MTLLLGLVAAALVVGGLSLVVMYNRFVRQRALIDSSWGGVDVELTRRRDLIPNLVRTVEGYADHERALLQALVTAREAAAAHHADGPAALQQLEEQVSRALGQVLVRVEAYPELKASAAFLDLQQQLTETEDRIAAARRFYNLNVGAYDSRVGTFPSNLVARLFHFERRAFFELTDPAARLAPHVQP
jgi:LemA protein